MLKVHDISLGMTSYRHVYPSIQARESIIAPFKLSIVIMSAINGKSSGSEKG